jgi:hypothetical protein
MKRLMTVAVCAATLAVSAGAARGASPLRWSSRLTEDDFTRAGAILTRAQREKLTANTYTLQSIVSSGTDRLVDGERCNSCHTGQPDQAPARYRPTIPIDRSNAHRIHKSDSSATSAYTWSEAGSDGVIAKFITTPHAKPDALKKIFRQWLLDGRQP